MSRHYSPREEASLDWDARVALARWRSRRRIMYVGRRGRHDVFRGPAPVRRCP